jgi:hypothetical protein
MVRLSSRAQLSALHGSCLAQYSTGTPDSPSLQGPQPQGGFLGAGATGSSLVLPILGGGPGAGKGPTSTDSQPLPQGLESPA